MKNLPTFEEFIIKESSEQLNELRMPKWWHSDFARKVIDAYKNGEFDLKDPESILNWDKKNNGGVTPIPAFNTAEIVKYALSINKDSDGKPIN